MMLLRSLLKSARCIVSAGTATAAAGREQGIHSSSSSNNSSKAQQQGTLSKRTQAAGGTPTAEDEQQQIDELHRALEPLGCPRPVAEKLFAYNRNRTGYRAAKASRVVSERISNLLDITQAVGSKQQQRLFRFLAKYPSLLNSQPATLRSKASMLQQEMQQQFNLDLQAVQTFISKHPTVLKKYKVESLTDKMVGWCKLLALQPAEVLALWIREGNLADSSMQLLTARLAGLQELLQLRLQMAPADVLQMAVAQPKLLQASAGAVRLRLDALQKCLADWTPQQLGAGLLKCQNVLTCSPDTIRYKLHVVTKYREVYLLGAQQRELQAQPQQQQPQQQQLRPQISELYLLIYAKERYAMLEYIMEQQQQQQQPLQQQGGYGSYLVNGSGAGSSSYSNISDVADSNGQVEHQATYMPPAQKVLNTTPKLFKQLVSAHYPGFWQWYAQRQQQEKHNNEQHQA